MTATSWDISDGSGSGNYPNNADCEWIFIASDPSATAKITFSLLDLNLYATWDGGLFRDKVEVFECEDDDCTTKTEIQQLEGNSEFGKFDGEWSTWAGEDFVVLGATRVMQVKFVSDYENPGGGFNATFDQIGEASDIPISIRSECTPW
jgi:hypothetical protein